MCAAAEVGHLVHTGAFGWDTDRAPCVDCNFEVLIPFDTDDVSGACFSNKSGFCNYGSEACGTNGQSPNDVCWSNCGAHAECIDPKPYMP